MAVSARDRMGAHLMPLDSRPRRADTRIPLSAAAGWRLEITMWWFIIGILALIVVVAIVLNRRGSTAAHDLSSDHHPDTSMGGFEPH